MVARTLPNLFLQVSYIPQGEEEKPKSKLLKPPIYAWYVSPFSWFIFAVLSRHREGWHQKRMLSEMYSIECPAFCQWRCQKRNLLPLFVPPFIQSYFLRKIQPDFEKNLIFRRIFSKLFAPLKLDRSSRRTCFAAGAPRGAFVCQKSRLTRHPSVFILQKGATAVVPAPKRQISACILPYCPLKELARPRCTPLCRQEKKRGRGADRPRTTNFCRYHCL